MASHHKRREVAGDEGRAKEVASHHKRREVAGDEGRAKEVASHHKRRAEAGDEGRAKEAALRKKRRCVEAGDKAVNERLRLYRLINSRAKTEPSSVIPNMKRRKFPQCGSSQQKVHSEAKG